MDDDTIERQLGFSWIDKFVCAHRFPNTVNDFKYLKDKGVTGLITLTEEMPTADSQGIQIHHVPIKAFHPPTVEQMQTFLGILEMAKEQKGVCYSL